MPIAILHARLHQLIAIVLLLRLLSLAQGPTSPQVSRTAEYPIPLEQGGKWGYVDQAGKFVIAPQFDSADPFSEGMAEVELNGRLGWISTDGHFVIQTKYFKAGPFKEGLAWVLTRKPWTPLGTGEYGIGLFVRSLTLTVLEGRYVAHFRLSNSAIFPKDWRQ